MEKNKKERHTIATGEPVQRKGFHVEPEEATIESWMNPVVFDVQPATILAAVTKKMLQYGLHHIFVTDKGSNKIVGIITTFDILQFFERELNP